MSKFKVGQRVWSPSFGWGEVNEVLPLDNEYPVSVGFQDDYCDYYTADGKRNVEDLRPTLFLDEPKEWPDPPAPIPDMPIDTPLWCMWGGKWVPRHFARIVNGKVNVFSKGKTSHTSSICDTATADEWSLTNPTETEKS